MAQSGFTPIQIYSSATPAAVPTAGNLAQGELAINTNDGKLFYEDSSGVVQVIATQAGAAGTVTSVAATAGTGISVSGSPITTSGTFTITNTAPDQTVALTAGTGISTSGTYPNFTITNTSPSSGGTVTSVGGTGTVNGITLTGTVTTSGNLTLGGTLSGVSLTTQVSGTLPLANGGTNATTAADARTNLDVPTRTGTNASGTWGISVTGSSASCTGNAATATSAGTWTTSRTLWGNSVNGSSNISGALSPSGGSAGTPAFSAAGQTSTGMYIPAGGVVEMSASGTRSASIQQTEFYVGFQNTQATVISSGGWVFTDQGKRAVQSNTLGTSNIDMYRSSDGTMINFLNGGVGVGGIVVNASSTNYGTSSDYRLKKDVTPLSSALAKVCKLNPVQWKWKSTDQDGEGFIAHELAEHFPQAVAGKKDAVDEEGKPVYQSVDSSFLVAALVASVKELSAQLEEVKAQLASFKLG